jgi:glyoxylase-like metal-dependent hydrolase (beta-lactamase superfamily II)
MEVRKIKVGYMQTNCYILVHEGKCLVIDPGDQFYSIQDQIGSNELIGILVTHRHEDHMGARDHLAREYNAPIYDRSNLKEGEVDLDVFHFEVVYTPGHRADCITIIFDSYNFMFTGDFLFKNSIGRTDLETGNMEEMKQSIEKIKEYSDRYRVYPGHGDVTTLGEEKENNPFLR